MLLCFFVCNMCGFLLTLIVRELYKNLDKIFLRKKGIVFVLTVISH